MILVSDAMSTVGGPQEFELYGEVIKVKQGRLVNANGSLAGAHICLRDAVVNGVNKVGLPFTEAVRMATSNPFEMMGLPIQNVTGSNIAVLGRIPASDIEGTRAGMAAELVLH